LFTILHNQHVNQIRRNLRTGRAVELSEAEFLMSRPADQDKRLELRDLERALRELPEEQRAAILLVGVEGFAYQEVAAILEIPTGTVRSRISRGRDVLRCLMDAGADPSADKRPRAHSAHRKSLPVDVGHADLADANCQEPISAPALA